MGWEVVALTVVAHLLIALGGVLAAIAGIGVVRLSTPYARIHAAGVASPVAFVVAGVGAAIELDVIGAGYVLIAAVAMLVTLPIGVHLLFRAVYRTADNVHLHRDDLTGREEHDSGGG